MNQTSNIGDNIPGAGAQEFWKKENLVNEEGRTLDFDLHKLPKQTMGSDIKKAAGVKHVISSEVDINNFTGDCIGAGRLKVRLSKGETEEGVKANLA